jgi:hypothetical protein
MEAKYPDVYRRTLQRDLRGLIEKGVMTAEGSTNRLVYRAVGKRQQTCDNLATPFGRVDRRVPMQAPADVETLNQ